MKTTDTIFYSAGKRIAARLRFPGSRYPAPGIVINHGYSGDKEEYDEMAEHLCDAGFVTLQFDSRGCGQSEAQKGRMMCATEWLEDAHAAVTCLAAREETDTGRIGFTGCSMGGAVTLYMAAMDERVKCAVALAPFTDGDYVRQNWLQYKGEAAYHAFLKRLEEDGVNVMRSGESEYVGVPYALGMNDRDTADYCAARDQCPQMVRDVPLESVCNSLIVNKPLVYAPYIRGPIMVIHGDADTIIPIASSHQLMKQITARSEFVVISGGPHPLPMCDQKTTVFEYTTKWFADNLV